LVVESIKGEPIPNLFTLKELLGRKRVNHAMGKGSGDSLKK